MKFIIHGRIPSKKNSRISTRSGRTYPSKDYQEWHKEQSLALKIVRKPVKPIERCEIVIIFYAPDKRRADLSNKAESIMDLLVDNGFLVDDNWFVCGCLALIFAGIDRKKPRAEVQIIKPPHFKSRFV